MKRLLAIILSLTIILCLPGCKSGQETDGNDTTATTIPIEREGKVVGISMPDETWESAARSLQTRLEALGYKTVLEYAGGDAQTQAEQLSSMANQKVDCIVVAAVDAITLAEAADEVASCGIPIVAYDRLLTDTDAVTYYLAPDYNAMGKEVGEYLISTLSLDTAEAEGKSFTFELFMGNPADTNSILFYDGILHVLQDYINADVLQNLSGRLDFEDVCVADGTAETADSLCSGRISNYYRQTPLDICISGTDTIAQGVISSLEYYGYTEENWPIITGLGYNDAAMLDGKLLLSIYTPTEKLDKACASLVDAAIFDIPCALKSDMTSIFNNTASIPTYLCGYQLVDTPEQKPEPEQEPEATPTEGSAVSTENTEAVPPDPTEDTEVPLIED